MKRYEVQTIADVITKLINQVDEYPTIFAYALSRNSKILAPVVESFKATIKIPDGYEEYQRKLNEAETPEERKNVVEENKELVEKVKKTNEEYGEFLNGDFDEELNLYKISIEDFPEKIDPKIVYVLDPLIKED